MLHQDWSIFAWGVGAGTGGGVGYTAAKRGNASSGVLAAVMAVGLIVAFKFLIALITADQSGEGDLPLSFGLFDIIFADLRASRRQLTRPGRGLN